MLCSKVLLILMSRSNSISTSATDETLACTRNYVEHKPLGSPERVTQAQQPLHGTAARKQGDRYRWLQLATQPRRWLQRTTRANVWLQRAIWQLSWAMSDCIVTVTAAHCTSKVVSFALELQRLLHLRALIHTHLCCTQTSRTQTLLLLQAIAANWLLSEQKCIMVQIWWHNGADRKVWLRLHLLYNPFLGGSSTLWRAGGANDRTETAGTECRQATSFFGSECNWQTLCVGLGGSLTWQRKRKPLWLISPKMFWIHALEHVCYWLLPPPPLLPNRGKFYAAYHHCCLGNVIYE